MKHLIGVIAALLVAAPAAAQQGGFYVGGHFGYTSIDDEFCEGASTCDDEGTAWRLLGGYQVNPHIAIELAYTDLGEVSASGLVFGFDTRVAVEATAIELVGVGSLPLSDRFSLYGKAGVYRADTDAFVRVSGVGSATISETNTDPTIGLGARLDVTQAVALRAEWQRYMDLGGGDIGEDDVDVFTVGALFRF
jgi:OOP family OmpA-OmpF porin